MSAHYCQIPFNETRAEFSGRAVQRPTLHVSVSFHQWLGQELAAHGILTFTPQQTRDLILALEKGWERAAELDPSLDPLPENVHLGTTVTHEAEAPASKPMVVGVNLYDGVQRVTTMKWSDYAEAAHWLYTNDYHPHPEQPATFTRADEKRARVMMGDGCYLLKAYQAEREVFGTEVKLPEVTLEFRFSGVVSVTAFPSYYDAAKWLLADGWSYDGGDYVHPTGGRATVARGESVRLAQAFLEHERQKKTRPTGTALCDACGDYYPLASMKQGVDDVLWCPNCHWQSVQKDRLDAYCRAEGIDREELVARALEVYLDERERVKKEEERQERIRIAVGGGVVAYTAKHGFRPRMRYPEEHLRPYHEYCVLEGCTCDHDEEQHPYPDGGCSFPGCKCEAEYVWPNG